jgi:hypothetical protein
MLHAARRRPRRTRTGGVPLPRADGRTIRSRRFRDLVEAYSSELALGGELTEAERSLVQQAAAVQIQCEELQRTLVEGGDIDSDLLIRLSSEHRRLLAGLGAKAVKNKPAAAPSLDELFAVDADEAGAE